MAPLQCHFCGAAVTIGEPIPRDGECESCRRDLRCCRNCRHWDPRYNNECRETMAEPVEDKTRRNFCEYFVFDRAPIAAAAKDRTRENEARAKLMGLFKQAPPSGAQPGAPSASPGPDAKSRLDALFKKKPEPEGPES
jgi:hypothetical protein